MLALGENGFVLNLDSQYIYIYIYFFFLLSFHCDGNEVYEILIAPGMNFNIIFPLSFQFLKALSVKV